MNGHLLSSRKVQTFLGKTPQPAVWCSSNTKNLTPRPRSPHGYTNWQLHRKVVRLQGSKPFCSYTPEPDNLEIFPYQDSPKFIRGFPLVTGFPCEPPIDRDVPNGTGTLKYPPTTLLLRYNDVRATASGMVWAGDDATNERIQQRLSQENIEVEGERSTL